MSENRCQIGIARIPDSLFPETFRGLLEFYENEAVDVILKKEDFPAHQQNFPISQFLRRVCLVRSKAFFCSALNALADDNFFAMVTLIRSHVETTGVIGHVARINYQLTNGDRALETTIDDLNKLLYGTRHKPFLAEGRPLMPSILTSIESADKFLKYLKVKRGDEGILAGYYGILSEFVHPNYSSNFVAARAGEELPHAIEENDFEMLKALGTSTEIFQDFHNALRPSGWKYSDNPAV